MKKAKLNIRYHNPNSDEETLKYITQIFIEASRVKFENVMREAALRNSAEIGKTPTEDLWEEQKAI